MQSFFSASDPRDLNVTEPIITTPYAPDQVGARIRRLRLVMGYPSQAAFAESIGVKRGELASWEAGMRRPSVAKAWPMVRRFRITLDWLFLGDPASLSYELASSLMDGEPPTQ